MHNAVGSAIMSRTTPPGSPNFSLPRSPQVPYYPAFDIQEMEMSSPAEYHGRTPSPGAQPSTIFAGKSANAEEIETDEASLDEPHGPIYDRLDYWFGGRMNLEYVLLLAIFKIYLMSG